MPLLTKENLLAPVTSKTNLLTILCVTVVFATFRLSGGAVSGSGDTRTREPEVSTRPAPVGRGSLRTSESRSERPRSNILTDLLKDDRSSAEKPSDSSNRPSKHGGLDEIERAIGLR